MNHFLLHILASAVGPSLCGRRIGVVRLLPPVLSIEFQGGGETRHGVVILSTPGPFCYFDLADPLGGLGTEVFRRVSGFPVTRVEVPRHDRVMRFELSGLREKVALTVSLFGSTARIRVESRGCIVESLDPKESGRSLPAERSSKDESFAAIDAHALAGLLTPSDGEKTPAETPERKVVGLTREILDGFSDADGSVDVHRLLGFRDGVVGGGASFMLGTRGRAGAAAPLPVSVQGGLVVAQLSTVCGPFSNAEVACREAGASILSTVREDVIARRSSAIRKLLSSRKRLLSALQQQQKDAESYETWRNEANMLAAYQSRIPSGASEVTLPDLYASGVRRIMLDPSVSIREQIKKRFKHAAKLERSRAAVEKRMRTVGVEIERIERDLAEARSRESLGGAIALIDECSRRSGLHPSAPKTQRPRSKERQLRRFDLDEQWFVLVGRSDRENDEITFRIASPDDIWFHAQHVAGSHVVLKSHGSPGNPPDSILEAAARIAAHFSKARRASVVPVIYTQRKYVRKFKGSKPGQVVCEREKTIFAEPRLPESAEK